MSHLETYREDVLWLNGMSKDYKRLQKPFGDFILFVLDRHLPRNFDRSVFGQWKESLSALRRGGEAVVMTVTSQEYPERQLGDLFSIVSRLNGAGVDGLKIEVQKGGVKKGDEESLVREVIIQIAKLDKTAQGVNGVIVHTGESACALMA